MTESLIHGIAAVFNCFGDDFLVHSDSFGSTRRFDEKNNRHRYDDRGYYRAEHVYRYETFGHKKVPPFFGL